MTSVLLMLLLSVIRALSLSPVPSCPASCVVCSDEAIICHRLAHIIVAPETTQALLLTEGSISTVQSVSLSDLSNITIIGLSNNHISVLGGQSFRKLPVLHTLLLDHNLLTSQALQEGALTDLAQLEVLALGHNLISMIEGRWFRGSRALRSLKLEGNLLTSIQTGSFPEKDLADLQSLDLSDNLIDHLESNSFDGLVSLHTLDLSRNRLSSAPVEAFSYLSWLTDLNLDMNTWNCSCQLLELAAFLSSFMQQPDKTLYNGRRMVCVSADNPAVTTVLELTEANCVPSNQNITVHIETRGGVTPRLYARDLAVTAVICFIGGVGLTLLGVLIYSQVHRRRNLRAAKRQKKEEEGRSTVTNHCVNHIDVHDKRRDKLWEREDMMFETRGDSNFKSRDEDHSGPFRCQNCNSKDQRGPDLMRWRNDGELEPRTKMMKEEERLFGNQQGVSRRDRTFSHNNTNSSSHPRKESLSQRAETEAGRSWRGSESSLCESCHRTYRGAEQRPGRSHSSTRESNPFNGFPPQYRHTDRSRNLNHNPSDTTKNPDSRREARNVTFDLEKSRSGQVKQEEGEERGRRHKAKVQSSKTLKVKLNLNPLRKSKVHPKRRSELSAEKTRSKRTREKRHEDEEREERKSRKSSRAKGSVEEEEEEEEEKRGKSKTSTKQKKDLSKKGDDSNKGTEAEKEEEQPASSSSAAQGHSSQGGGVQYQGAGLVQQSYSLSAASRNQTTNLSLLGPAGSQLTGSSLSLQGGHFLFPSGPGMTPGRAPDSFIRPTGAGLLSPAASLQVHPGLTQPAGLASSFGANPAVPPAPMQSFMQPPISSPLVAGLKPDPAPQMSEAHPLPPESQVSQSTTLQTQVPPGVGGLTGPTPQPPGPGTTVEDLSNSQSQPDSVQIPAGLTGEGLSVNEGLAAGPSGDVPVPGVAGPTVSTPSVSSPGDALLQQEYLSEDGGSSPRRKLRLVLPEKTSGRPPTALERKIR